MVKIGIITGSTRPGRNNEAVAKWAYEVLKDRNEAEVEVVDIADYNLPLLDEAYPPSMGQYQNEHTKKWAEKIDSLDGFIFITPEYNHGVSGALKNAIDFIYAEWNNKSAGFVSYGSALGSRAVEQLRGICAELQIADVRAQVLLSLFTDFEDMAKFTPDARHTDSLNETFNQVVAWAEALKPLRG